MLISETSYSPIIKHDPAETTVFCHSELDNVLLECSDRTSICNNTFQCVLITTGSEPEAQCHVMISDLFF